MHSNRPYEAGRAKAKQDLGLHPVQPPAPWTQEVDKRLRVRTGSAREKDPSEKRAYGLSDALGDVASAATTANGYGGLDLLPYELGGLSMFAGSSRPVGEHWYATPIMSHMGAMYGELAGRGLAHAVGASRFRPYRAAGAALGSLAGRTALRGFDTLRERTAKKKEAPPDAEKKSFENADRLPGGPADNRNVTDFDPKQLLKGQRHEMEHTTDPSLAREIASDHLTEHPNYYERLLKAEKNWGK